jgi:predicted dehydrogenase
LAGFHPAALRFKEIVDSGELGKIVSADASMCLPAQYVFGEDDIRFNYSLGGGAMTDVGVYALNALRWSLGSEPTSVEEAVPTEFLPKIDSRVEARLTFPYVSHSI